MIALTLGVLAIAAAPPPARCESRTEGVQATQPSIWSGKSVALTSRAGGRFALATRGAQLSAAIAFAAIHHVQSTDPAGVGASIAAENGLEDGASYIGKKLRADAVAQYGAVRALTPPIATTETASAKIARAADGADLVIDVRPLGAALRERVPGTVGGYLVGFSTSVWVIDARAHTRIAQGSCQADDGEWNPMDDLLANGAGLLKSKLHSLWDECVLALETTMLRFAPTTAPSPPNSVNRKVPSGESP